jgi:two-component system, NtrC family, response regulator HydG
LDEIADISLKTQTDLLRVLQEKEIVRVGGVRPIKVDFRCIAATNKSLEQLIKDGSFRPDLYYRLHVFSIDMPPLRERREDIPLLAEFFLRKSCETTNREVPRITQAAMELLMSHEWPGNVRALENAVERALVIGKNHEIEPAHFALGIGSGSAGSGRSLDEIERAHIERTIRELWESFASLARARHRPHDSV